MTLGWDEESWGGWGDWNAKNSRVHTETLSWEELDDDERQAAESLVTNNDAPPREK